MYGHRSSRGVISKYGCDEDCPVTMHVTPKVYTKRSKCLKAEKRLISKEKPIWNTKGNHDPNKARNREAWKEKNCSCPIS